MNLYKHLIIYGYIFTIVFGLIISLCWYLNYKGIRIHFSKMEEKTCSKCKNYKTMDCPNSYLCHSTKDKPYFKRRDKK